MGARRVRSVRDHAAIRINTDHAVIDQPCICSDAKPYETLAQRLG
jgi:hypothetical protein